MNWARIAGIAVALLIGGATAHGAVTAYPLPSIYHASETFALLADGQPVPVISFSKGYDYAAFECPESGCQLRVTDLNHLPITRYSITPEKLAIPATISGSDLLLAVRQPEYLIVSTGGSRKLVIAIDPPQPDVPPAHGPGIYNVTDDPYRADPTGQSTSTAAIRRAVTDAGADPDHYGIVYVPSGVYALSTLQLISNVSLYLAPGAVLRCDGSSGDFTPRYIKESRRQQGVWFIYTAQNSSNIKIFGRGTIDANGKDIIRRLNLIVDLVVPINCTNFTLDGPTLVDSSSWGTVIANCDHVVIRNTKHFNPLDVGEDDCVDICDSQNVRVERSIAISLDDPYSCKTWAADTDMAVQWGGHLRANENIRFENCIAWTRCFGFKVGAGAFQPQENLVFHNCVVHDAAHAIGISDSYGYADLRNILFDTLDVERTTCTNLGRSWARFAIDNRNPTTPGGGVYDVKVINVRVRDPGTMPIPIEGLSSGRMIHGVTFENILMPGEDFPATTLAQIGVRDTRFADGISVQP
jgi:hypothetical protein